MATQRKHTARPAAASTSPGIQHSRGVCINTQDTDANRDKTSPEYENGNLSLNPHRLCMLVGRTTAVACDTEGKDHENNGKQAIPDADQ